MFRRLTDSQKNFRKQMKEVERENLNKQMNGEQNAPFYSHYKEDMITSYYEKKNTKKRIFQGVSIASIVFILWNAFAIFSWLDLLFRNLTNMDLPIVSSILDFNIDEQRETVNYLKKLEAINEPVRNYLTYQTQIVEQYSSNSTFDKNQRVVSLQNLYEKIDITKSTLNQIDVPTFLRPHKSLIVEQADTTLKLNNEMTLAMQATSKSSYDVHIRNCNDAINEYNNINQRATQELISIFDRIGIEYEFTSNGLKYTYRY